MAAFFKMFNQRKVPPTEEPNELGTELETLCKDENLIAQSNWQVFKVSTSSSPLLKTLTDFPEVAVKKVIPSPKVHWVTKEWKDVMQREWNAQEKMKHKNLVRLVALGVTADCR